ncbi:antibiotic biosynthesis monooxygenase [Bradyrhizobium sp. LHD-71]|uniref:antibiotic biosynthesis monooxygenase n=1 Tax=Bradyrhizobium sp. LHD-71 TaxID=3072141 RepID=UPI00280E5D6E|nr:antibiotic biosynthesis monooxygenase [Bradyrhizobium sp. LHD-71]MDQ8731629.1 antibiotic biosynthesis monooxygenase [Bradyrhizobium sp. LHD-71]
MQTSTDQGTPVTAVIRQWPKADAVEQYEAWLSKIVPLAQQFTGHRGVNVIRPHGASDAYTIVLHFDTTANLRKWFDSEPRQRLVERIRPLLRDDEDIDVRTGLEFWFAPPTGGKHARPYKQFLVTLSVIFPLTIIVPWLLQPLFEWLPMLATPGIRHLLIATAIVAVVTYLVMPHYTRLISRWLYS